MAKAERKSNPFGWILLGIMVGGVAVAGVLLVAKSMNAGGGYEEGPREVRTAADDAAATVRPAPVVAAPKPELPVAPPVAPIPAPAVEPPTIDAQMADDAAAAGMTSRSKAEEQPSN